MDNFNELFEKYGEKEVTLKILKKFNNEEKVESE